MIILIMFISAVAMFASIMFINHRAQRIVWTIIFGVLFVLSTALMTLNYSCHFGMHRVTTTSQRTIYSASNSSMPLALYQPVGTSGKDDVYIYNTKVKQKTPNHTQADEYTSNHLKWTNRTTARLTTTETRWRYRNGFFAMLYMWSGMDGTLIKRTNTLEYPRTFVKITTKQAQDLKKRAHSPAAKQAQATIKQRGKATVATAVQQALAKDPQMNAQEIQAVAQQADQRFQSQMVKQLLAKTK